MADLFSVPRCLACEGEISPIQSKGLALEGGTAKCPSCGEDFSYTISEGKMVLKTCVSAARIHGTR